jgi:hypothetical protein
MTHQHSDARFAVRRWDLGLGGTGLAHGEGRDDNHVIHAGHREVDA